MKLGLRLTLFIISNGIYDLAVFGIVTPYLINVIHVAKIPAYFFVYFIQIAYMGLFFLREILIKKS